jgi:O-antigen/teichoic acid export membrane protein
MAVILLVQSIQNALVNSPTTTLFPSQLDDAKKGAIFASSFLIQCVLTISIGVGGSISALYLFSFSALGPLNSHAMTAATLAAIGLIWREYIRGTCYLHHRAMAAVKGDLLYLSLASASLAGLAPRIGLTATVVFFCIAIASVGSAIANFSSQGIHWKLREASSREAVADILACSKWALPSVVISWSYANGFLYAVAYFKDDVAVAEISASRLFLAPISLLVIGWSSVFRPRVSRLLADRDMSSIDRTIRLSAVVFAVVSIGFGSIVAFSMPYLEAHILGSQYGDLSSLVIAWAIFFMAASIRTIGMSAMLASKDAFRLLFFFGCAAMVVAIPCVIFGSLQTGNHVVIYALAAVEAVLALIIWFYGWPRIKSSVLSAAN